VSGQAPREVAERAREAARGEHALVTVTRERSLALRFARSRPTQATSVDDLTVEVAAVRDGHVGRAATNDVGSDALRRCADAAVRAAETAAGQAGPGAYPGFPEPGALRSHPGHDPETARLDPARGGDVLSAAFEVAAETGTQANGLWTAGEVETAIATPSGPVLVDRVTDAFLKVVAFGAGGRSGYAARTGVALRDIDARAVAAGAAAKATAASSESVELEPGEYTVVMESPAVHALLWVLGQTAFNGLAHAEARGALAGRLGTRVVSAAVNLSDSPRYASTLPRAFDAEGVPKAPLPLIQDGVAHGVVHDVRSGAIAGASSTGHAQAGGLAGGPLPTNLVMVGGGAADERELCAGVERGIYVTRLWYTNVLRPEESLFTAVTRDGTFLIEDGRVTRPVADMRVTDSALGVLSRIRALGARSVLTSDGELYGRRFASGSVCPPLQAGAVRFTGSAAPG
jgi:predicted Zn-dependent protease